MPTGLFYGIATNPLLAQRAGLDYGDIQWRDVIETFSLISSVQKSCTIQVPDTSDEGACLCERATG